MGAMKAIWGEEQGLDQWLHEMEELTQKELRLLRYKIRSGLIDLNEGWELLASYYSFHYDKSIQIRAIERIDQLLKT